MRLGDRGCMSPVLMAIISNSLVLNDKGHCMIMVGISEAVQLLRAPGSFNNLASQRVPILQDQIM